MQCGGCGNTEKFYKSGSFRRSSDRRVIQRYKCAICGKSRSAATDKPDVHQNKRQLNEPLRKLLSSNISKRRAALVLSLSRTTVDRKCQYLAEQSALKFDAYWSEKGPVSSWQFDELQTIEHSKLKPLSVVMAVESKTRKIMGFEVSEMPATGHLARRSRLKYGPRRDLRKQGLENLLQTIQARSIASAQIRSDQCQFYQSSIRRYFKDAKYRQFKGEKATVCGQGELKKVVRDPLFGINHTFAMLRANINRLIRKTWCTTKDPCRLKDHLMIYAHFHNTELTPN